MAKRRKPRKSSKCPEPFNTLIDIAGGIAMNAIANKAEKKYNYSKKGKINPYKVSAFKIGTGGFKSTGDIMRTGAFLGAMGSFDVEADTPTIPRSKQSYINVTPDDPIFNQIKYAPTKNNKYAWRLNCKDGSGYGIDPRDYETRAEYNAALERASMTSKVAEDNPTRQKDDTPITNKQPASDKPFTLCRVSLLSNGKNIYSLANDEPLKVGDKVLVSLDEDTLREAIVISVEQHTASSAPADYEQYQIIKKI